MKRSMNSGWGAAACVLVLVACGDDGGATGSEEHVIRIGTHTMMGFTGSAELLAIREINAAGGITIDGVDYKLDLVRAVNDGSLAAGVKSIDTFVDQGVVAAVGPPFSSTALGQRDDHSDGAVHAAAEHGIMLVSPMATSAAITDLDDDDLMWRTVPSDIYQGSTGAGFVYDELGARTAAILVRDDPWGNGLADTFTRVFEEKGGQVVVRKSYDGAGDLSTYAFPELGELFADRPDVVYLCAFDEVAQITNRIAQEDYLAPYGEEPPTLFGTDATFLGPLLTNGAPGVLDGMMGTVPSPNPASAGFQHFAKSHVEAGLGEPSVIGSYAYDAVYLIALAIQAAQSERAADFKLHMRAVSLDDGGDEQVSVGQWAAAKKALLAGRGIDFEGSSGPITFTPKGDAGEGRYTLWKVQSDGAGGFGFDMSRGVDIAVE